MARYLLLPLGALALASCGGEPADPPSVEQVAEAADNLVKPTPGLYRSTARLTEFEVPGLPEAQVAQMREMMGASASQSNETCLTPEQAEEGFRTMARQLGEGQQGVKCEFARFDADGSTLDAALTCTGPGGVDVAMDMDGTIEPTRSDLTMTMTQKNAGLPGGGEIRLAMAVQSERIGDCP